MSAETEIETTEDEQETTGGRRMDPEVRTISLLIRTLDDLDPAAAERVMDYLHHRYVRSKP